LLCSSSRIIFQQVRSFSTRPAPSANYLCGKKGGEEGEESQEAPNASTRASQKHEISLNISGVLTLGHSQALGSEMVLKLREGGVLLEEDASSNLAQTRTTVHGEIIKVREGMDTNRNHEAQAIRDEIAKLSSQLELQNSNLDFQTKLLQKSLAFALVLLVCPSAVSEAEWIDMLMVIMSG
jgi:hypothetical protein